MVLARFKKRMTGRNSWVAYGVLFGVVVGVLTHSIGLWLAVGFVIGAGMGVVSMRIDKIRGS
jgi:hypothetical protein